MTALPLRDFTDAERERLEAIEAAPAEPESVREVAKQPLTCDNEADRRGVGSTPTALTPTSDLSGGGLGVSLSIDDLPATFPHGAFWAKVERTSECWLWTARRNQGYGVIMHKRKNFRAHRISWVLAGRTIPDDLVLDHLCRVRHCVNPAHLELVTSVENVLRGEGHTARNLAKTNCPQGHPYSGENLGIVKATSSRFCKTCSREQGRRRARSRRTCPQCDARITATNLPRHIRNLHNVGGSR